MAIVAARRTAPSPLHLEPEESVDLVGDQMVATSTEPWLRVEPAASLSGRRWVRLRYVSSYFDDPVRPMMRFDTAEGRRFIQFLNGPVLGAGEWIGRIPDRTIGIWISPVHRPGPFQFQLLSVDGVARGGLVRRGLSYDRNALLKSIGAKIINAREERWEMLKFAASATPFESYAEWHRRLYRPIDVEGFDRPRTDWRSAPTIRLFMPLQDESAEALRATVSSLQDQVYPRWSLHGLRSEPAPSDLMAAFRAEMARDRRLNMTDCETRIGELAPDFDARDVIAVVHPGGLIPNHALAVLADAFDRQPKLGLAYGDEDSVSATSELHSPLFKPDWSPVFFSGSHYLGRLICFRAGALIALGVSQVNDVCRQGTSVIDGIAKSSLHEIRHIRRILFRSRREVVDAANPAKPIALSVHAKEHEHLAEASIVIPTRDRAALLRQCIDSLGKLTDPSRYRLVIVDNGSTKADAIALLSDLRKSQRCQVLDRPGPFNFSALCNAGARAASSSTLVFLNNDIVIIDGNWLKALLGWAVRPDIGVVGAKLLFPDRTIEHAGVVLGHGSIAGHIYHRQPAGEPGYLGQLQVPHEVEAATGACIAIEKAKFEAIGGFDENLRVEFNDIDLCLRATARGWVTVWTPHSVLYHLQSASRGYPLKPYKVFRDERDTFLNRWVHVIRDDRYFHPALSLYSHRPALA